MFSKFLSMLTLPLRRIFTSPILMIVLSVLTYSMLKRVDAWLGSDLYGLLSRLAANFRLIFASADTYAADIQLNAASLVLSALVVVFVLWWAVIWVVRHLSAVATDFVGRRSAWVGQLLALQRGRRVFLELERLYAIRPEHIPEAAWVETFVYRGNLKRTWSGIIRDAATDFALTLAALAVLLGLVQWLSGIPALSWAWSLVTMLWHGVGL